MIADKALSSSPVEESGFPLGSMNTTNRLLQYLAIIGAAASGVFFYLGADNTRDSASKRIDPQLISQQLSHQRSANERLRLEITQKTELAERQKRDLENISGEALLASNQILQLQRENKHISLERGELELISRKLQEENSQLSLEFSELKANSVPSAVLAELELQISSLEAELLRLRDSANSSSMEFPPALRAEGDLDGKVLLVGKEASFVVLDIGYNNGVRLRNELYVLHADTPVAKVHVTEVKENLCIAHVLPGTIRKRPQSGDSVASLN